eukprot:scaffold1154_cov310-Pinguiococcus_pyrenoidosus.AAC.36
MLYPLARKDLSNQGPRMAVKVGDKLIDYNENFRMLLVTRSPDPHLPPDAAALLTIVNFTVTKSGLENQLLGTTIQHEQPELEKAKLEMLKKEEDFKVQLADLEKQLLQELATAEGDILENTVLITSLQGTKVKAREIQEALEEQKKASEELDMQRERYRDFSAKGAKLYFLLEKMGDINVMYSFGIGEFVQTFKSVLQTNTDDERDTERRLEQLGHALVQEVYKFAARAMFKADRLLFALHVVRGMFGRLFLDREWEVFVGDLVGSDRCRDMPKWAAAESEPAISTLETHLPELLDALDISNSSWSRFSTSPEAERDVPKVRGLSSWQRVLVVQAFRADRLRSAIDQFCADVLKMQDLSPGSLSLAELYDGSRGGKPVLFICTEGNSPSAVAEFAVGKVGAGRYHELSLGGGQEETAIQTVKAAGEAGDFVFFKNLHLLTHILPEVEEYLNTAENLHEDFRLWLTTEASPGIPKSLLKASTKVSMEADVGLKKNATRCIQAFHGTPPASDIEARLRFMMCFFHAEVSERVKYVPYGYVKPIEFNMSDLKAALMTVSNLLQRDDAKVDYTTLQGLLMDAIYGPKVEVSGDLSVVGAYVKRAFRQEIFEGRDRIGSVQVTGLPYGAEEKLSDALEEQLFSLDVLPDDDSPALFSLPNSIGGLSQKTESVGIARRLRDLQVDIGPQEEVKEGILRKLAPIFDMWEDMRTGDGGKYLEEPHGDLDPLELFVQSEMRLAVELFRTIDGTMSKVKRSLYGSKALVSSAVKKEAEALQKGAVPISWQKKWDNDEESIAAYLNDAKRRYSFVMDLGRAGGRLLETKINLRMLFRPRVFLSALRQAAARDLRVGMNELEPVSTFGRRLDTDCRIIARLDGFYLRGAVAQGDRLVEVADLPQRMDVCELSFRPTRKEKRGLADGVLSLPVYDSDERGASPLLELDFEVDDRDALAEIAKERSSEEAARERQGAELVRRCEGFSSQGTSDAARLRRYLAGSNFRAAAFMQYRLKVGGGPSLKT